MISKGSSNYNKNPNLLYFKKIPSSEKTDDGIGFLCL